MWPESRFCRSVCTDSAAWGVSTLSTIRNQPAFSRSQRIAAATCTSCSIASFSGRFKTNAPHRLAKLRSKLDGLSAVINNKAVYSWE